MLPILGDTNRRAAWPGRIAKLQSQLQQTIVVQKRIAKMFVESEQSLTEIKPSPENLLRALVLLNQHAHSKGNKLTTEFLFELQHALGFEEGLRVNEISGQVPGHNPAKPSAIATLLETTLEWFDAESFRDLHSIEQAVLVHARFLDLQFFPTENTRLSRVAADFFLIRASLPPIMFSGDANQYKASLHQALLMNTQPLIDLIVEATEKTLGRLIGLEAENREIGESGKETG